LRFIDTNIFLRFLTHDDPEKAAASGALFTRIQEGEEEAMTTEAIVSEVFYVMSGRTYRSAREVIADGMRTLLSMRGLHLDNKQVLLDAFDIYEAFPNLDLEDCIIAATMFAEGIEELYSFDRGFDRVPGITRMEPVIA
jgi:predicted nucleic acid-binding protein